MGGTEATYVADQSMTTIVDTDALIGLLISSDVHYFQANDLYQKLIDRDAQLFLLPSTLSEFATVAVNKIGLPLTQRAVQTILQGYTLLEIHDQMTRDATALYFQQSSKGNSLFDCYVMSAARNLSFDKGYTQNGFVLARELMQHA